MEFSSVNGKEGGTICGSWFAVHGCAVSVSHQLAVMRLAGCRYQGARLYQVCLDLTDPKTRRRELSALVKAGEELGITEGKVLTWDEEGEEMIGAFRLRLVPVWKWLMGVAGT